jgi:hypothetical protein
VAVDEDQRPPAAVSLQVAASAAGNAALPAGIGLAIAAVDARVLAPALLVLGLAMCGVCRLLPHPARRAANPP